MGYRLITPPAATPVTLAEAKQQLRVDHADEDAKIEALIAAATSYLDGRTGILQRCLITQTWELTLDYFPCEEIEISLGPVQSVVSLSYVDTSGATQNVSASEYVFDNTNLIARIIPKTVWPKTTNVANAVVIRFVAGTSLENLSPSIKHAMLLLICHWYDQRSSVNVGNITGELPFTVDALVTPFRSFVL